MADGLLSNVLNAIDQQKRDTAASLGLLFTDPQAWLANANDRLNAYNQTQLAAIPAERNELRGIPLTREQQLAKQYADQQMQDLALGFVGSVKPTSGLLSDSFNVIKRDASDIFGAGAEKIRYVDPKSGGTIEVLSKPDKTASVMSLEVPEQFRGKKIGESLQARVLQDFPEMQGQVSSKAAAKTAYRLGRRPVGEPNATLDDVFKAIEDNSSVNLVSPEMQKRFTGNIKPVKQVSGLIHVAPDVSYRGSHTAPNKDFGAPLYDLTGGGQMYPADVYSSKAVQYYGTGYPKADREAFNLANMVRGNPEAEVTMYRAVPKRDDIKTINIGDWVTLSKEYAKVHGQSALKGDYKIISKKVKAKDLWTNADSIHEFGYNPTE